MSPRVALLAVLLALSGCAARRAPSAPAQSPVSRREAACAAPALPVHVTFTEVPTAAPPDGERIDGVEVRGARNVPTDLVLRAMKTKTGAAFDTALLDADLLSVEELSVFEDVRFLWERRGGRLLLIVDVEERPVIGEVFYAGDGRPDAELWQAPLPGDLYEPAAVSRSLRALDRSWKTQGHLDGRLEARARRVDADHVDLCLSLDAGRRWMVDRVAWPGLDTVPAEALGARMDTRDGEVNVAGKPFRPDLLSDDVLRMHAVLYDRGYLTSNIGAPRITRILERSAVVIEVPVSEGPLFHLGRVTVSGRLAGPRKGYEALLQQAPGDVFSRARMLEAIERIRNHHRALTGKHADVEPITDLHAETGTADVDLRVKESP